jgi:hypothetical protein
MSGIIGLSSTNMRSGMLGNRSGDILKVQHFRNTASGSSNNGYPIVSAAFFAVSTDSTIKIESIIAAKANTNSGIPVGVCRHRWSGYGGSGHATELSGHNEWGERTPNDDSNDRAQVDIITYHHNTSTQSRIYSLFYYGEWMMTYGGGDTVAWQSGDRYMIITEFARGYNSTDNSQMHN